MFKKLLFFISFSSMALAMDDIWGPSPHAIREQSLKAGDDARRFASVNAGKFNNNNEMPKNVQNDGFLSSIGNNKIPCAILIFFCYL